MKTDFDLQSDVLQELLRWPHVDAALIGVMAENGMVTLTGQVAHCAEKAAAEDATRSVDGVMGTANDIVVVAAVVAGQAPGRWRRRLDRFHRAGRPPRHLRTRPAPG